MFIKGLSRKTVNTKYGQKEKYLVIDETGQTFDSWVAKWNASWREGDDIQVKPEQIQTREWEGKSYYTILPPPDEHKGRGGNTVDLTSVTQGLANLDRRLSVISQDIAFIKSIMLGKQEAKNVEPWPEDIPQF